MSETLMGWKPDTCDCTFLVVVPCNCDGNMPQNHQRRFATPAEAAAIHAAHPDSHALRPGEGKVQDRVFEAHEDNSCAHHGQHPTTAQRGTAVLAENRRKNLTHGIVRSRDVAFFDRYQWSYDANRVLHVTIADGVPAFTAGHKQAVQAICDVQFGAGTVVVG